ncbi:alkyl hydroperoxide reductase/ Thiol specific antioxidant/ Mal allergen [Candidatus Thiomargarita nelsonii]|uniref:thioredoxin-dependent peroxiredoxin n=1 Tax=Candidatus Thiomargarita nelsonii TaxID=1003181 RepID=A0A176S185_9GAMM|nr:alkyl hydroperoxide reductase/ Thiol specific antioxidant/ Mal allergen [Candidatus Thiomargarita nelsonii]
MTQEQTLRVQTTQLKEEFIAGLPEEVKRTVGESLAKLLQSDVAKNAKTLGDKAPDFNLPNVKGEQVRLSDAYKAGPVVLSFYRGGWCPFCNLEMRALQQHLPQIKALGASLIAISPQTPDNSLTTAEKLQLEFEILSDQGNKTARDYGLLMQVYEEMRSLYLNWGFDLPAANGDDSYELPVPATYVIDREGIIRSAYVDKDYTTRMEPTEIINALQQM